MRAILGLAICCLMASGQTARRAEALLHDGMRQQRELEQRLAERQREQQHAAEESMRHNRVRLLEPVPAMAPAGVAPVESALPVEEQQRAEAPAVPFSPAPPPDQPQRSPIPFALAAACLLACISLYNLGKIARQRYWPNGQC